MNLEFAPGDLIEARNREWIVLSSPRKGIMALRPLTGSEEDKVLLDPQLEIQPVRTATFELPENAKMTTQTNAVLLADALRLTLRRGAGPFRSASHITFEPRYYQLVPLIMALRLQTLRLLIADDVGVGKTIEAGLILREFIDRGEVNAFTILCPPHLVEQWLEELKSKFGIDAVAVTASSAANLEKGLPISQTIFDTHKYTVVSLDYIKADRRRETFINVCPDFVIIDEAHTCLGNQRGRQQRYNLLSRLSEDENRRMIMLTATPHSGDENAFSRLLSLINNEFENEDFSKADFRERLARHYVQRRRIDIVTGDWGENQAFPDHETTECEYKLTQEHFMFQESVLDYCLGIVSEISAKNRGKRRLALWETLALMRCVGSSPAAALSALRNKMQNDEKQLESHLFDDDGDDEDAVDIEPSANLKADLKLQELIDNAKNLIELDDPKVIALINTISSLLKKGANIVVFCRYLATADHVWKELTKHFSSARIEKVSGVLTPSQRQSVVSSMEPKADDNVLPRILVSTDCLSEGINLQQLFDTVVHYDLSWNPTRHQQREGRVDRFGQTAKTVRSIMMYSPDSAIDGAILDVIFRKAREIRKTTGVTVPLPDDRGPVTDAIIASIVRIRGKEVQQEFEFEFKDGTKEIELFWRDTSENEKRSRARFAQNSMKPQEVIPEWKKVQALLGSPADVKKFIERAMSRFGVPLESRDSILMAHVHKLENSLKSHFSEIGMNDSILLAEQDPAPIGSSLLTRTHPLTIAISESILEASLDPEIFQDLGIGRIGAWPTNAVSHLTELMVLRIRYKLTVHSRKERLLLAEEAALVALEDNRIIATGEMARDLLNSPAEADLAPSARERIVNNSREKIPVLISGSLSDFIKTRSQELAEDHARLRLVAGNISRVSIESINPPDLIGFFVLLPHEG